jgi:asparagine synthase (glutamine-hydrolysing)
LVSAAAQKSLGGQLRTFNVRFSDKEYDETWAALTVAKHIQSHHETLEMDDVRGNWEHVTNLLSHVGQPFADTSLFAVNAVCRRMRQHVTVALSGDGGDEAFGGYDVYWRLARIADWQRLPIWVWRSASVASMALASLRVMSARLNRRLEELTDADDTTVIQSLFCEMPVHEQTSLCQSQGLDPIRRLFEPRWQSDLPRETSRLERLSARATEVNVRVQLPNDFLFKVDAASMKESLEVRVPMLDEDLFSFGLTLPQKLKVDGSVCKLVLRKVAERRLPLEVANKPKRGFGIPVDRWVDADFRARLKDTLLGSSSRLPEFFRSEAYRPMIDAFSDMRPCLGVSRSGLYRRAIMLLSVHLALCRN